MPAGALQIYTRNLAALNIDDLLPADVRLALVTSAYVPNVDETSGHQVWADVSANQIAAGNGYSAGGQSLAGKVKLAGVNAWGFDSNDPSWTASGGNIPAWRYGVLYVNGALWGLTNPLIGYFLGDTTPADVPATMAGNPLNVQAPAPGWFDMS